MGVSGLWRDSEAMAYYRVAGMGFEDLGRCTPVEVMVA